MVFLDWRGFLSFETCICLYIKLFYFKGEFLFLKVPFKFKEKNVAYNLKMASCELENYNESQLCPSSSAPERAISKC